MHAIKREKYQDTDTSLTQESLVKFYINFINGIIIYIKD